MQYDLLDRAGYLLLRHWPTAAAAAVGYLVALLTGLSAWTLVLVCAVAGFLYEAYRARRAPAHGGAQGAGVYSLPCGADFYPRRPPDPAAFDRVIGLGRAKQAIVDALETAFRSDLQKIYNLRPAKGILLYGPPGTGKTSFARAAADRFGCSFYVVNASSLAASLVGQTEANIRYLFAHARQNAPAVIFFDEIDAIGQKRSGRPINSPSDLAINVLLSELDGFRELEGVVVVAATNRPDTLDEALTRAGRFDVKIEVGLPGREDREKLFALYLKGRPCDIGNTDLSLLALETEGLSPADIRLVCDQAALAAAKKSRPISVQDVREAVAEVRQQKTALGSVVW